MIPFKKPNRLVTRVFLHCSASSNPAVTAQTVRDWHVRGNRWPDIGYHYFIRSSGLLEAGRPLEHVPAAQYGHNVGTIAICLNGLKPSDFTSSQFFTLIELCDEICHAYNWRITFHGHNEVSAKACPVFDYRSVLQLEPDGKRIPKDSPVTLSFPLELKRNVISAQQGSRGFEVKVAQGLLTALSPVPPGKCDGIAGPRFEDSVKAFQKANDLLPDGYVDLDTWKQLEGVTS